MIPDTIGSIARALRLRELSVDELVCATLARIDALNPQLEAFLLTLPDSARAEARAREAELAAGHDRGPLHGVPIAIKDIIDVRGTRTTGGSVAYADSPLATNDAAVVARLREAGAVIIGKTATHELAIGGPRREPPFPTGRNPWSLDHITGGSSSGNGAAVGGCLVAGGVGSDTGGSIRTPSSHCGLTGLKTTFGRVPLDGVMPLCTTMDSLGPMAHDAADARLLFQAMAGLPFGRSRPLTLAGVRIGLERGFFRPPNLDPAIAGIVDEAARVLAALGADVFDIVLDDGGEPGLLDPVAMRATWTVFMAEAYAVHQELIDAYPERFGERARTMVLQGRDRTAVEYVRAMATRQRLAGCFRRAFERCDLLLAPVTPQPPQTFEEYASAAPPPPGVLCMPANLAGLAALAAPAGFTAGGLPVGVQLVGPANSEELLLDTAEIFQSATDWHLRRPPSAPAP